MHLFTFAFADVYIRTRAPTLIYAYVHTLICTRTSKVTLKTEQIYTHEKSKERKKNNKIKKKIDKKIIAFLIVSIFPFSATSDFRFL